MPTEIRYELLLDLYRGKATAVEQISDDDRKRLAVPTPITRFLCDADESGNKHVLLTGNAGDGKTFAIVSSDVKNMTVIRDASEALGASADPLVDLAHRVEEALAAGERLLVAINRGQLERLAGFLESRRDFPLTSRLFEDARPSLRLRVVPVPSPSDVAVIDLGLFDTLSDEVLDPILNKVAEARITDLEDGTTLIAVLAAQAALRDEDIRRIVKTTIRYSRQTERHATMRQLWSVVAFLISGGRAADEPRPQTLEDSIGARLFAEESRAPLLASYRSQADPSLVPQPRLAHAVLTRSWSQHFEDLPGLGGLLTRPGEEFRGRTVARAGAVHGAPIVEVRHVPSDPYEQAVNHLRQLEANWHQSDNITSRLLGGAYSCLGLWHAEGTYPAWSRLCFDATRAPRAGAAAFACIEKRRLALALPRPNTEMLAALGSSWWPPYLLLGLESESGWHQIRLTPRLFRLLYAESDEERRTMTSSEALLLERWLSGAPTDTPTADRVWVGHSADSALCIEKDPLSPSHTITLQWQGGGR